uniref:Vezatin n=1 Tax=Trichuris muris TaxID=70415 RepID=A0A5S6QZD3_TRIMR
MSDEAGLCTVIFKGSPFYEYLAQVDISEEVALKEDVVESSCSSIKGAVQEKSPSSSWYVGLRETARLLRQYVQCHICLKLVTHVLRSTLLLDEDIACLKMVQDKWTNLSSTDKLLCRLRHQLVICLTLGIALTAVGLSVKFDSQVRTALRLIREQEMISFGYLRESKQAVQMASCAILTPSVYLELRVRVLNTCQAMFMSLVPLLRLKRSVCFSGDDDLNLAFKAFPVDIDAAFLEFGQGNVKDLPLSFLKRFFVVMQIIRSQYLRAFILHYFERSSLAVNELCACTEASKECTERLGCLLSAHVNLQRHCSSLEAIRGRWEKTFPDHRSSLFAVAFRNAVGHLRFGLERCTEFSQHLENITTKITGREPSNDCQLLIDTLLNELRRAVACLEDANAILKDHVSSVIDSDSDSFSITKANQVLPTVVQPMCNAEERNVLDEVFEASTFEAGDKEESRDSKSGDEVERDAHLERVVLNELKDVLRFRRQDMEIREEQARQRMYGRQIEGIGSDRDLEICKSLDPPSLTVQYSAAAEAKQNETKVEDNLRLDNANSLALPNELRDQFVKNLQSALSGRFS